MYINWYENEFKVCVETCPNKYWVWAAAQALETTELATKTQAQVSADRSAGDFYCKYNVNPVGSSKVNVIQEEAHCN